MTWKSVSYNTLSFNFRHSRTESNFCQSPRVQWSRCLSGKASPAVIWRCDEDTIWQCGFNVQ